MWKKIITIGIIIGIMVMTSILFSFDAKAQSPNFELLSPKEIVCGRPTGNNFPQRWIDYYRTKYGFVPTELCLIEQTTSDVYRMELHGTEYIIGDGNAKIWLQLLDSNNTEIDDAVCFLDVFTPKNGYYIQNAVMENMGINGIYYYDLEIPSYTGVFPATGLCFFEATQETEYADGFTLYTGTVDAGDYTDTWVLDGDEHKIKQSGGKIKFEYQINDMCGVGVSEELLTSVSIKQNVKWTESVTNDDLEISWWNFSSGQWVLLPNIIPDETDRVTISNTITTNNVTRDGIVNSTGNMRILYNDTLPTLGTDKKVEFDWLEVTCDQLSNPEFQVVKGSSEMHVRSNPTIGKEGDWISNREYGNLTNETFLNWFDLHYTLSSTSSTLQEENEVYFDTFNAFPCAHINDTSVYNQSSGQWETVSWGERLVEQGSQACQIFFDWDLEPTTNYNVRIRMENIWKRIILSQYAQASFERDVIEIACENYQEANGLTNFTIPLETQVPHPDDELYTICQAYFDNYYYYELEVLQNFIPFISIPFQFTSEQMDGLEAIYEHNLITSRQLQSYSNTIANTLNLGGSYSLSILNDPFLPINPNWSLHFSSISSSYFNYLATQGVPTNTWNFPNRTLTDFPTVNASIDYSPIFEKIDQANVSVKGKIDDVNSSLFGKLFKIQDEITSVNDTVKQESQTIQNQISAINQSISGLINSVLLNITAQITNAITSIINPIQSDIDDINATILEINETIAGLNITPTAVFDGQVNVTVQNNITLNPLFNVTFNGTVDNTINFNPNITVNYSDETDLTPIANLINIQNDSIHNSLISINNTVIQESQTIQNQISAINQSISGLINSVLVNITAQITNAITSIIFPIQADLDDINETLQNLNLSPTVVVNNTIEFNPNITVESNVTLNPLFNVSFNGTVNIDFQPNITVNFTDATNLSSVLDAISQTNQSIFGKLFLLSEEHISINDTINLMEQTLLGEINNVHLDVWSSLNRTLTEYPDFVDEDLIASLVWNYSSRTLTQINATIIGGNITINPQEIWNYPNKTLDIWCDDTTDATLGRCVYEFFWRASAVGGGT